MYDHTEFATAAQGGRADAAVDLWPRIEIPLNPAGSPGNWTDYEIKIYSVTNSAQDIGTGVVNVVYFHSTAATNYDAEVGDSDPRAYYVDDSNAHTGDYRGILRWTLATNFAAIAGQFVTTNTVLDTVLHFPSRAGCVVPWTGWMRWTNAPRLRASFLRLDDLGAETNAFGYQRWHPVAIDWVPGRPSED